MKKTKEKKTKNKINTHAKGSARELEARKLLAKDGWLCETKNWNRYRSKDFYNCFDIIAIKGVEVRLIQVKSNPNHVYDARHRIKAWMLDNQVFVRCEIWCRENYCEWTKEIVNTEL